MGSVNLLSQTIYTGSILTSEPTLECNPFIRCKPTIVSIGLIVAIPKGPQTQPAHVKIMLTMFCRNYAFVFVYAKMLSFPP